MRSHGEHQIIWLTKCAEVSCDSPKRDTAYRITTAGDRNYSRGKWLGKP